MNTTRDDERWRRMLHWLRDEYGMNIENGLLVEGKYAPDAGRGLFATRSCPPSTVLFVIPAKALLNTSTLAAIYPSFKSRQLTAEQQISLHLLLNRPHVDDDSFDPVFGPYLSTLPRHFDSHPLSWLVNLEKCTEADAEKQLLRSLPPSVDLALQELHRRFLEDWNAVRTYLRQHVDLLSNTHTHRDFSSIQTDLVHEDLLTDYLWAWLNVNTRCIYYRTPGSQSERENLTLCPILDFANHRETLPHITPISNPGILSLGSAKNNDFTFVSTSRVSIKKDQQLFLRYGGHVNRTLFVEYGFVNHFEPDSISRGAFRGEINVQDILEMLFSKTPSGARLRDTLEEEGYWGEWTLDSCPIPAHPSYRLITALRLYHLAKSSSNQDSTIPDEITQRWRDVINGRADVISSENEQAWRQTLLDVCETISRRAQAGMIELSKKLPGAKGWVEYLKGCVWDLWREEYDVATAVAQSIRAGEDF